VSRKTPVNRAVVDDGEKLVTPARNEYVGDRLLFSVGARASAEDEPAGALTPVGQAVGAHAGRDHRNSCLLQDRQRRLDRLRAEKADDDGNTGRYHLARRRFAALGRAGVVDDVEVPCRDAAFGGRNFRPLAHLLAERRHCAGERRDDADRLRLRGGGRDD
jgi:hypothetical protein